MSAALAEPTWHERELPFLAEALRQLEEGDHEPGITAIAEGLASQRETGSWQRERWTTRRTSP